MKEIASLLAQSDGARWRRADLHVHTPASADMDPRWASLEPNRLVEIALGQDLELISVTDHNSVAWCDRLREAAEGSGLVVLPGVEVSTSEGHLLAVFDRATPAAEINEFLVSVGIRDRDAGRLDAIASESITNVAKRVHEEGGLAIAAHVDRPKGFWEVTKATASRRKQIYACEEISAFELYDLTMRPRFENGSASGYTRRVTCVQGSDCYPAGGSMHQVDSIGTRHSFLSMGEVGLPGIRQSLLDPQARTRLMPDARHEPLAVIEGFWVSDGFFKDQSIRFSTSISCLIGGTGSGKSLSLELLRFALGQQIPRGILPRLHDEVAGLLGFALGALTTVSVLIRKGGERYLIERTWAARAAEPKVSRVVGEEVEPIDHSIDVPTFFPVRAFSQGEIIEYAREPLARLTLLDDLIDLDNERAQITKAKAALSRNAAEIVSTRNDRDAKVTELKALPGVSEDVKRISTLIKHPSVKQHQAWLSEQSALRDAKASVEALRDEVDEGWPTLDAPLVKLEDLAADTPSPQLVQRANNVGTAIAAALAASRTSVDKALDLGDANLAAIQDEWKVAFQAADLDYQKVVATLDPATRSQAALTSTLATLKSKENQLRQARDKIEMELAPRLVELEAERDQLLDNLQRARTAMRSKRESKAEALTGALERKVLIRVKGSGDTRGYIEALRDLRTGSHLQETDLDLIAAAVHPIVFVKAILKGEFDALATKTKLPVDAFRRFRDNIVAKERELDLYAAQLLDVEDVVRIQFAIEGQTYRDLGELAHGQKCTVVLMIALAEGDFPLLVDQPEDALHAPWIEGYIVSSLRARRGSRQCIFATRSANVLVSTDSEQIIGLQADAKRGVVTQRGALDSFQTRDLVLYHVEGGEEAFTRRQRKYDAAQGTLRT